LQEAGLMINFEPLK